ncbi:MAG: DNA-directed RNA polymerase subunit omega, partial [Desulforhabdus sp.]|nr:DNA-directed RNA polymerase subunit omega [Desulforhabdus sp.]
MARVTIEDCLEQVDSRFTLVHLAVRRVLQLRGGASQLLQAPKNKEVVLALREVAAGKVTVDNIRQLDEQKALLESPAQDRTDLITREEVKELMDNEMKFAASLEYDAGEEVQ